MDLLAFALRRLGTIVPTLLAVSVLIFLLQQLLPGDPALALAGDERTPEVIEQIRQRYGFDQPLPVQYANWIGKALIGDLGESYRTRAPVTRLIASTLPVTMELAVLAMTLALLTGIPAGVIAAVRDRRAGGALVNVVSLSGLSVPHFWLGIMMILLFSVELGWLPASGYVPPWEDVGRNLVTLIMPAIVLGTRVAAVLMRHTRSAMLEILQSDYIRTAHAKGLSQIRVVAKHALRNALVPVITLATIEFGYLLSGAVLTEQIFSIPGMGKLIVDAVFNRDYAVVQGVVLVAATLYILMNLVGDLLYFVVSPRMRA